MGAGASVGVDVKLSDDEGRDLFGGMFDQSLFDNAKDAKGLASLMKLQQIYSTRTDVFLTHDWGMELGMDNHDRVRQVNAALKRRGLRTWFDEDKMEGNVKQKMVNGIENASCIIVFVTKRYMDKVGGDNAEDNCFLEFNYAARRKTATRMVAVVMEQRMRNTANWTGILGLVLGGSLFVDFSDMDSSNVFAKTEELYNRVLSITGNTLEKVHEASIKLFPTIAANAGAAPSISITAATSSGGTSTTAQSPVGTGAGLAFMGPELTGDDALIKDLSDWFVTTIRTPRAVADRYAKALVDDGIGTITKLSKKVARSSDVLLKYGIDEDDVEDIAMALSKSASTAAPAPTTAQRETSVSPAPAQPTVVATPVQVPAYVAPPPPSGPIPSTFTLENAFAYLPAANDAALATKCYKAIIQHFSNTTPLSAFQATTLVEALRLHGSGDASVAETGLEALKVVTVNSDNQAPLGNAGVFSMLAPLLHALHSRAKVAELACEIVRNACRLTRNKALAGSAMVDVVLRLLSTHLSNATVANQGCRALWNLAVDDDNELYMVKKGAMNVFVSILREHKKVALTVEGAAGAIRTCAFNSVNKPVAAEAGAIRALIDAAQAHTSAEAASEQICRALWNIAVHGDSKTTMVQAGGLNTLITCLKTFQSTSAGVCEGACGALRSLAVRTEYELPIAELQGIELILSAMKNLGEKSSGLVEQGCAALNNICANKTLPPRASKAGGLETIVRLMRTHANTAGVAEQACRCLWQLAQVTEHKRPIVQAGGLIATIEAISIHRALPVVCEQGARLVRSLAIDDDNEIDAVNAGALELFIQIIKTHTSNKDVCQHVCGAFRNLTSQAAHKPLAMKAGVAQAVLEALEQHHSETAVSEDGVACLRFLASNGDNQRSLGTLPGLLPLLLKILSMYEKKAIVVCDNVCRFLWNFCCHTPNQAMAIEGGAISAVHHALVAHREAVAQSDRSTAFYEGAIAAVRLMAADTAGQVELAKCGISPLVLSIGSEHGDHKGIIEQSCRFYWNYCLHKDNKVAVVQQGVVEHLLGWIQRHASVAVICETGLAALKTIALNTENKVKLAQKGCIAHIFRILREHKTTSSAVMEQGLGCLRNLSVDDDNELEITRLHGIELARQILEQFPTEAGLVASALGTIRNLSTHSNNKPIAAKEGAITITIRMLREYPGNDSVWEEGCAALKTIAVLGDNQRACGDVLPLASQALPRGISKPAALEQCLRMLWNVCLHADNKAQAGKLGLPKRVIDTLTQYPDDVVLAEQGAGVLNILAYLEANNKAIVQEKGHTAILAAMKRFPTSATLAEYGCKAVWNLATDTSHASLLGDCGAVEVVVQALSTHGTVEGMAEQGCWALKSLTQVTANQTRAIDQNAIEAVAKAVQNHPKSNKVAEQASHVLCALAARTESAGKFNKTAVGAAIVLAGKMALNDKAATASAMTAAKAIVSAGGDGRSGAVSAGGRELVKDVLKTYSGDSGITSTANAVASLLG